jgi:mRNA interferase RelE/StbE
MVYEIQWDDAAVNDLNSFSSDIQKRIIKKVGSITKYPFHFVERLTSYPFFKLRVGDYRAILDIQNNENQIIVILVGHRSKVYQELKRREN